MSETARRLLANLTSAQAAAEAAGLRSTWPPTTPQAHAVEDAQMALDLWRAGPEPPG